MLAQLGAFLAAVDSVVETIFGIRSRTLAGMVVTALTLAGCMPTTVPLAGADPADPGAKVAGVGYRSTIAPLHQPSPDRSVLLARAERTRRSGAKVGPVGARDAQKSCPCGCTAFDFCPFRVRDILARRRNDCRRQRRRRNHQEGRGVHPH